MIRRISVALLTLLLVGAGIAWWETAPPSPKAVQRRAAAVTSAALVDESTYATALRMAQLAGTPEEQPFVQTALRVADHELALAFTAALRDVEAHPPTLSPEALKIQERLRKSQALLEADQQRITSLTADIAQAKSPQKETLQDELELARSQLDLDKDELEEANQDLAAAGGNPQQRIEAMLQEHEAQEKARAAHPAGLAPAAAAAGVPHGSLMQLRDWMKLRQKMQQLAGAQAAAAAKADALGQQRVALATSLETSKGGIAELAQHTAAAKAAAAAAPASTASHSHDDAATLLTQTKLISAGQKILTLLDRQGADQRQLASVYEQWRGVVTLQASALAHRLLLDGAIVLAILLALLFLDKWVQRLLDNRKLDRRQVETLRSITRMSLRVVAVLIILLILVGMPNQFGTMIGIVGAGLTVALKDFIVAFFGWLVLMGRNGIRLGDWVEINGVSGEVTELGMFHTVLLETGNWSDAGHPTGRRVTFTNSFAIEGHYFNFSTSGQWLWDELKVVVPAGQDPYPVVDAITKQVADATAESARQADLEWQRAVPTQRGTTFSGTPGVNVKPVIGGVEISVRYITRANERFQLRAKLYQAAVDLLGKRAAAPGT
ncbi:MAG: LigA [Gammaproteobacteria bacterium]|nr:LigA [Gammaproteobacteria bacterium]